MLLSFLISLMHPLLNKSTNYLNKSYWPQTFEGKCIMLIYACLVKLSWKCHCSFLHSLSNFYKGQAKAVDSANWIEVIHQSDSRRVIWPQWRPPETLSASAEDPWTACGSSCRQCAMEWIHSERYIHCVQMYAIKCRISNSEYWKSNLVCYMNNQLH